MAKVAQRHLPGNDAWFYDCLVSLKVNEAMAREIHEHVLKEPVFLRGVRARFGEKAYSRFIRSLGVDVVNEESRRARGEILLRQMRRRGLVVSRATESRVYACKNIARLNMWLDRVLEASSAAEVFES